MLLAGTNGSGKSAVLQALQFCLGVQAAKTGRAGAPTPWLSMSEILFREPAELLNVCCASLILFSFHQ